MKLANGPNRWKKSISSIIRNHKRKLLLGILLLIILVGLATAAIYYSMSMQGTIDVRAT